MRISICFAQTTATAHKRQTISQLPAEYFILDNEARREVLQFIRLKQETHLDKAHEEKLKKLKNKNSADIKNGKPLYSWLPAVFLLFHLDGFKHILCLIAFSHGIYGMFFH